MATIGLGRPYLFPQCRGMVDQKPSLNTVFTRSDCGWPKAFFRSQKKVTLFDQKKRCNFVEASHQIHVSIMTIYRVEIASLIKFMWVLRQLYYYGHSSHFRCIIMERVSLCLSLLLWDNAGVDPLPLFRPCLNCFIQSLLGLIYLYKYYSICWL